MFDEMFDYNLMARLSLGRNYWLSINSDEKKEFVKSFISLLKESFIEKLKLYNNQDMLIKDFLKNKTDRAKLITKLIGKKNSVDIVYKFYYSKQRGWIIYDVVVAGVSIIQSYREQFSDLLNNMTFVQFLKKIKKTNTNSDNA
jgi:phospholipid transport system substrate-binding protein